MNKAGHEGPASGTLGAQFDTPANRIPSPQAATDHAIRAELIGADTCKAAGIMARSGTPILVLCRRLIAAGHDSTQPLEAYRGDTLCLRIRSIGEGSALVINGKGSGFKLCREAVGAASPVRENGSAAIGHHSHAEKRHGPSLRGDNGSRDWDAEPAGTMP